MRFKSNSKCQVYEIQDPVDPTNSISLHTPNVKRGLFTFTPGLAASDLIAYRSNIHIGLT